MAEVPSFEKVLEEIDRLRATKTYPFNQVAILWEDELQHLYTVDDGHEGMLEIRVRPNGINYTLTWSPLLCSH
jgi:hypothetical protein